MPIFTHLDHLTLDSTHLWCKRERVELEKKLETNDYLVISTQQQTGGVGRHLRPWHATSRDLTFNLAMFDPIDRKAPFHPQVTLFPQIIALVITKKMTEKGVPCQIKWPNDLMTEKGKLGGILSERLQSTHGFWLCIGIGINQIQPSSPHLSQPADAIEAYANPMDPKALTLELAAAIYEKLASLAICSFHLSELERYAYFKKGDFISLEKEQSSKGSIKIFGYLEKMDHDGRLHLMTQEGTMMQATSGECFHVRKEHFT